MRMEQRGQRGDVWQDQLIGSYIWASAQLTNCNSCKTPGKSLTVTVVLFAQLRPELELKESKVAPSRPSDGDLN